MRTALLVAVLGFSVWSASAWALPFDGGAARGEGEREHSTPAKHRDRSRPQADDAGKPPTHATTGRWTAERKVSIMDRRVPARAVPAVPEPSALMLFGVGLLVALRAPAHLRRTSQCE